MFRYVYIILYTYRLYIYQIVIKTSKSNIPWKNYKNSTSYLLIFLLFFPYQQKSLSAVRLIRHFAIKIFWNRINNSMVLSHKIQYESVQMTQLKRNWFYFDLGAPATKKEYKIQVVKISIQIWWIINLLKNSNLKLVGA